VSDVWWFFLYFGFRIALTLKEAVVPSWMGFIKEMRWSGGVEGRQLGLVSHTKDKSVRGASREDASETSVRNERQETEQNIENKNISPQSVGLTHGTCFWAVQSSSFQSSVRSYQASDVDLGLDDDDYMGGINRRRTGMNSQLSATREEGKDEKQKLRHTGAHGLFFSLPRRRRIYVT